ncbi:MAG: OmpA family protein [Gemmatimonadota bacterium]
MKHRLTIPVVLAALALGGAAACGGNPEPEGPTPEELAQMREDSIQAEQARQDSIRRAEQARQDSLDRVRERERAIRMETEAAREIMEEMIHFAYDRSEITPEAEQKLMQKVAVMRANPDVQIRIAGHADERGSIEYNRALGQRRAEAAKDFLVGFGIASTRITTVSFGEDRPLVNASNEDAWAMNRRDEFSIVAGGDQLRVPGGS